MKIKDLLETPIGDYKVLGDDQSKQLSMNQRDLTNAANPNFLSKIRQRWEGVPYTVNFYLINMNAFGSDKDIGTRKDKKTIYAIARQPAKGARYGGLRPMTEEELVRDFGSDVAKEIWPVPSDEISIMFLSNASRNLIAFTPWMLAHRMYHALFFGGFIQKTDFEIPSLIDDISRKVYGARRVTGNEYTEFMKYIFTFRTARQGVFTTSIELAPELFAQWMLTGDIKFEGLPETITQDGKSYKCLNEEAKQEYNAKIQKKLDGIKQEFEHVMMNAKGLLFAF